VYFRKHLSRIAAFAIALSVAAPVVFAQSVVKPPDEAITPEFAKKTFEKVDALVRKHFYDGAAMPVWQTAVTTHKDAILGAKSIVALDKAMNQALGMLKVSHTQFVTPNDETFFFLKTLFASRGRKKVEPPKMDYVGAVTGGVGCSANQVRYVLDASPAEAAGMKIGDEISTVGANPYIGQLSWKGTSGKVVDVKLRRAGTEMTVKVKPALRNDYDAYVEAIGKSVEKKKVAEGNVGYVHVWCGSQDAHDAVEEALDKLQDTDGLIFDLRDGYGGNFYNDLDYFYRPVEAYPTFTTVFRNGKKHTSAMTYTKPVVALINGGSRSGKELIALSLKRTKRATLVGENTAGFVLAGRLFDINDRAALYLAVAGGDVQGEVLEGKGVAPDVEVKTTCAERGVVDKQYDEALRILREKMAAAKTAR
jgi:carboxyl-terminal processing protease